MRHRIAWQGVLVGFLVAVTAFCHIARGQAAQRGKVAWRSIVPGHFGAMFGPAISPHDSKVIIVGTDVGSAFMTRNGGKTWKILGRSGGKPFANPGYRGMWGVHFDPKRADRIWIGSTHGLYRTTDGGKQWQLVLGGSADYAICPITTDPTDQDIVYVGSGISARTGVGWVLGNIWKSADGGGTWRVIHSAGPHKRGGGKRYNWVTIAVDPQSPFTPGKGHSRVYVCGHAGFLVSENAGNTWTALEEFLPGGVVNLGSTAYTSGISTLFLATGKARSVLFATIQVRYTDPEKKHWLGGVYASYDGGRTWEEKNKGLERTLAYVVKGRRGYSMIVGCRAKPEVMYWSCSRGVYKTDDAGRTWRRAIFLGSEYIYQPDFDGRTVDWRVRRHGGNFDQSYYNVYGPANGLACSSTDPDAVAYTDNATIGVSFDGGKHWTEPGFEYGEVYWPKKFGDRPAMRWTHKVRSRGVQVIEPRDLAVDPFDPKTIAIGHSDIGLVISRDNGAWWEWAWHGILCRERNFNRAILYDPAVKGRLWTGGGGWGRSGHVYQSDDGGRTFRAIGIPQLTAESERSGRKLYVRALALDPASPKAARTIYVGTDFGLYRTLDGGKTWQDPAVGLEAVPSMHHLLIDPTEPTRLYASALSDAGEGAGLYRSEDAGHNWVRLGPDKISAVKSMSICRATGTLYVLANRIGQNPGSYWALRTVWRTDDHGKTWHKIDDRRAACVGVHPRDADRVYIATYAQDVHKEEVNVFRSTDGGETWEAIADDVPFSAGGEGNKIVFDRTNPSRFFLLYAAGTYEAIEP